MNKHRLTELQMHRLKMIAQAVRNRLKVECDAIEYEGPFPNAHLQVTQNNFRTRFEVSPDMLEFDFSDRTINAAVNLISIRLLYNGEEATTE